MLQSVRQIRNVWCPSHSGISGNDIVDIATSHNKITTRITPTSIKYHLLFFTSRMRLANDVERILGLQNFTDFKGKRLTAKFFNSALE